MKSSVSLFLILAIILVLLSFTSCNSLSSQELTQRIGIFLPCFSPERWKIEGDEMTQLLEDKGYEVELYYAKKDAAVQKEQIKQMMESGVDAMIVAAVNPDNLAKTLDIAAHNGTKIIAYDIMLTNTDAVSYFVTFDNYLVGIQQGTSLIEGLKSQGMEPYNIEIFAGCKTDANAEYFYNGAMSIIQPLIDAGRINIVSNQILQDEVCVENWCKDVTGQRLEDLLSIYYAHGTPLHGILSPIDILSATFVDILKDSDVYTSSIYPIITGQDAELANVIAITDSKQYSTVLKDSHLISQVASSMVIAVLNDEIPEINDVTSFYNGVKIIPTFLCEPILVTRENYESILIDTGYIEYDKIFPTDDN